MSSLTRAVAAHHPVLDPELHYLWARNWIETARMYERDATAILDNWPDLAELKRASDAIPSAWGMAIVNALQWMLR